MLIEMCYICQDEKAKRMCKKCSQCFCDGCSLDHLTDCNQLDDIFDFI